MNLSKLVVAFVILLAIAPATQASTLVKFGPASNCPTYCTGFATDDPSVNVQFINSNYNGTLIIQVNGVYYSGAVIYTTTETISSTYPIVLIQQSNDVNALASDGSYVVVNVKVRRTTTKVNSGRAHYYLTKYYVLGGTVTLP